ncbi:MAG: hypothetical protein V2B18_03630 [Pseudomonadota bacterium]
MDKYAVYAPNIIFYWDTDMNKQKVAALTSTAERLRNKKAIVVYLATEDAQHDRRLLLVDIIAPKDRQITKEIAPPAEKPGVASSGEERPKVAGEPERAEEPPFTVGNRRESSETGAGSPRPQPPSPDRPKAAEQETVAKMQPEKVPAIKPGPMEKPAPTSSASISNEEVSAFIRNILELNQKKDMAAIMSHFADQVDYYDRGIVGKDYIRKDMGYYFRNWDRISSSLVGDVVLIVTDEPHIRTAKFVSSFSVANAKKSLTGRTENIWRLQRINNELKIIDEKQRLLSSESR